MFGCRLLLRDRGLFGTAPYPYVARGCIINMFDKATKLKIAQSPCAAMCACVKRVF